MIEEEVEVLYIYELQVLKDYQRKGLGKFIIMIIEGLARKVRSAFPPIADSASASASVLAHPSSRALADQPRSRSEMGSPLPPPWGIPRVPRLFCRPLCVRLA